MRIHLATDVERFVWGLAKNAAPDSSAWYLRDRLLAAMKRWKSLDYRLKAINKEVRFYEDLASWSLDKHENELNMCHILWEYLIQIDEEKKYAH
jgi:hypothetical protein